MSVPRRQGFCLLLPEGSLEQCVGQSRCSINVEERKVRGRAVGLGEREGAGWQVRGAWHRVGPGTRVWHLPDDRGRHSGLEIGSNTKQADEHGQVRRPGGWKGEEAGGGARQAGLAGLASCRRWQAGLKNNDVFPTSSFLRTRG